MSIEAQWVPNNVNSSYKYKYSSTEIKRLGKLMIPNLIREFFDDAGGRINTEWHAISHGETRKAISRSASCILQGRHHRGMMWAGFNLGTGKNVNLG